MSLQGEIFYGLFLFLRFIENVNFLQIFLQLHVLLANSFVLKLQIRILQTMRKNHRLIFRVNELLNESWYPLQRRIAVWFQLCFSNKSDSQSKTVSTSCKNLLKSYYRVSASVAQRHRCITASSTGIFIWRLYIMILTLRALEYRKTLSFQKQFTISASCWSLSINIQTSSFQRCFFFFFLLLLDVFRIPLHFWSLRFMSSEFSSFGLYRTSVRWTRNVFKVLCQFLNYYSLC